MNLAGIGVELGMKERRIEEGIHVNQFVGAGFPVFLFPALLDHVMSFVVVRSYSMYQL